ncbi:MAG: antibiotic biosynthesis monooxygenase family protein [Rudaea sp.]
MTPEILRYRIPAERAVAFAQAYASAGALLQRSPHCLGYELLHSDKDPELWLLTIHWDSAAGHLQGFRKSALFAEFLALVRPFIENLLEMEHYTTTDFDWRRP